MFFFFLLLFIVFKSVIVDVTLTPSGPSCSKHVSLTSSLRGQLVKSFMTLLSNTSIFFVEKLREVFALQKLLTFFQQKYWHILDINV